MAPLILTYSSRLHPSTIECRHHFLKGFGNFWSRGINSFESFNLINSSKSSRHSGSDKASSGFTLWTVKKKLIRNYFKLMKEFIWTKLLLQCKLCKIRRILATLDNSFSFLISRTCGNLCRIHV